MPDPINVPGAPVPVVKRDTAQVWRRAASDLSSVIGAALAFLTANQQQLLPYLPAKRAGAILLVLGLAARLWQTVSDAGNVHLVNNSPGSPADGA